MAAAKEKTNIRYFVRREAYEDKKNMGRTRI